MSFAFLTRRHKITFALAFVLAWSATLLTHFLSVSTHDEGVFEGAVHMIDIDTYEFYVEDPNPDEFQMLQYTTMRRVVETSGWPWATRIFRSGSYLSPCEVWTSGSGTVRTRDDYYYCSDDVFAQIREAILASGDERAIDTLQGNLPPPGPRLLGWIGNVIVWWGLCYMGIALTLALARGTDRATHIPREVIERERIARGACLGCAYDIRGLGDEACCPECGRTVHAKAREIAQGHSNEPHATDGDTASKLSAE